MAKKHGERIKSAREGRHLTQKELADSLNVHSNTVARWEAGDRDPSFEIVEAIAKITNKPIGWFFGESSTPSGDGNASPPERTGSDSDLLHKVFHKVSKIERILINRGLSSGADDRDKPITHMAKVIPFPSPASYRIKPKDLRLQAMPMGAGYRHADSFVEGIFRIRCHGNPTDAFRVEGNSMHPVIPDGSLILVEPRQEFIPGEFVVVYLCDSEEWTVKELVQGAYDESGQGEQNGESGQSEVNGQIILRSVNNGDKKSYPPDSIRLQGVVTDIIDPEDVPEVLSGLKPLE